MLRLEQISKNYGGEEILKEISLSFEKGVYGLLAPNGAGKTTLIKLLVTLIEPTSGQVLYNEQPIQKLGEVYREQIGFLPQHFGYYKHQTPKQYLRYLGVLKGMQKEYLLERIEDVLNAVSLAHVKDKKMKKFSGGMIQRVGIAQALLADPQIIILDEPTAGLDPKERARLRHLLADLAIEKTIIISTHVVSDIETIANRVIMLRDKKILYNEKPQSICKQLKGQIFETKLSYAAFNELYKRVIPLSEKQEDGEMIFRFYSTSDREENWVEVQPQLEDVFLIVYADVDQTSV